METASLFIVSTACRVTFGNSACDGFLKSPSFHLPSPLQTAQAMLLVPSASCCLPLSAPCPELWCCPFAAVPSRRVHPLCKAAPDSKLFPETACHHPLVAQFAKHTRAAFLNETAQFMPPFFPNASSSVQGQHPPMPSLSNWDLQEEDAPLACSPSANIPGGEAAHIAASAPHTGLLHPSRSCRRPNHTAVQDRTNVGSPCPGWGTGCSVQGSLGCPWTGGEEATPLGAASSGVSSSKKRQKVLLKQEKVNVQLEVTAQE